ncbi:hypothetical protein CBP45_03620 [Chlamydia trachomatis]|nr:hypothetical protein CTLINITIAL_04920 [Chlamydia trachomatis L2/434/Bu(i)]AGO32827.1 hypothetical protein CTLFINAL_04920 [Chlamydia trachomatis L2/434/Bu(f)]AKC30615.1 hypothetical protein L2bCS78408_03545 [Chlamydia trachomatis]AKC31525.1 hypothetical protein L2bCS1908_03545 [Chlamydia trachomatis]ARZ54252.1 hypothetical protein BW241_03635 [Chlamydia trachomatis]
MSNFVQWLVFQTILFFREIALNHSHINFLVIWGSEQRSFRKRGEEQFFKEKAKIVRKKLEIKS